MWVPLLKGGDPRLDTVELDMTSLDSRGSFIYESPGILKLWTGKFVPKKTRKDLRKIVMGMYETRGRPKASQAIQKSWEEIAFPPNVALYWI